MTESVVIVGAGTAGYETAVSLRAKGFDGEVTVLGEEPGVPYHRPPLSKSFLKASADSESVALRPIEYFAARGIFLRNSSRAIEIDRSRKRVEVLDGKCVEYDHLVLATGSRNRLLPVVGVELPGVLYLRTLVEAGELASRLAESSSVVVIGGGFIGLEVAAAARSRGASVTVIETVDRLMARAVSETVSAFFLDEHRRHGVEVLLDRKVEAILEKRGRAAGVRTDRGETIEADVVVVGVGVTPNTDLAQRAGLPVDNGVVVDQHLRTADSSISAIGDCASYPNPTGSSRLRLESVQNAVDQARCVANRLVGEPVPYSAVPWFWTEQHASKLQIVGLITGYDTAVLRGSVAAGEFSVFSFAGDTLIGVESVNRPRDHMVARKFLASGGLTREQAMDHSLDLKTLVAG